MHNDILQINQKSLNWEEIHFSKFLIYTAIVFDLESDLRFYDI